MIDDIVNISRAVHYEMSYLNHVSKSKVLSESSFKYPAVEWLERQESKGEILFEQRHPVFYRRKTDISWWEDDAFFCVEMKYVKEATAGEAEQQRYFDDLLRLTHILLNTPSAHVCFLACGQAVNWMQCFQNLGAEAPLGNMPAEPYVDDKQKKIVKVHGIYSHWFSFDGDNPTKEVSTTENQDKYKTFVCNYKFREDGRQHPEGVQFRTTLRWISEVYSMLSPCATAAWEVSL